MLRVSMLGDQRQKPQRPDQHVAIIDETLEEFRQPPREQRHRTKQIFDQLNEVLGSDDALVMAFPGEAYDPQKVRPSLGGFLFRLYS